MDLIENRSFRWPPFPQLLMAGLLVLGATQVPGCAKEKIEMETSAHTESPRRVTIDFMFIDLTTCDRCLGTETSLDVALDTVKEVLEVTGVEVEVRKTLVETEEQARKLEFTSSPTIRVNGRDIALERRETTCGACSDIGDADTDCRIWVHNDREYTEAPAGMIVEAVLREVYGGSRPPSSAAPYDGVPDNLRRFFTNKAGGEVPRSPQCGGDHSESPGCVDTLDSQSCCCRGKE